MKSADTAWFWAPRILAILFVLFLSLFALDVFEENTGFVNTLVALVLHLLPVFLVLAVLASAWKWEWVGAIGFFGMAAAYVVAAWGRFAWPVHAAIAGPLLVISLLFLLSWQRRMGMVPGGGHGAR